MPTLQEQQQQSTSLEAAGTASSSRSESGAASSSIPQPSLLSAPFSKTPLHSAGCLPGPSRPNPSYLMNDFSNPKAASEALVSLAGINAASQRAKRSHEESSPIPSNRTNGVIFSPSPKMPRLDALRWALISTLFILHSLYLQSDMFICLMPIVPYPRTSV